LLVNLTRDMFPAVKLIPRVPSQRALQGLLGLVSAVDLADFIVAHGDGTSFDYTVLVDGAQMHVPLGNRSRAAPEMSIDGLCPLPVGRGRSADAPRDIGAARLFNVVSSRLSVTASVISRLMLANIGIPAASVRMHPMATQLS
jgi:hypothetical protein